MEHQHYKNLEEKNYRQYTHDALLPTAPAQPGLVMWGRKRSDAVMVVAAVEVRSPRFEVLRRLHAIDATRLQE